VVFLSFFNFLVLSFGSFLLYFDAIDVFLGICSFLFLLLGILVVVAIFWGSFVLLLFIFLIVFLALYFSLLDKVFMNIFFLFLFFCLLCSSIWFFLVYKIYCICAFIHFVCVVIVFRNTVFVFFHPDWLVYPCVLISFVFPF
jgi:hypothetical protein